MQNPYRHPYLLTLDDLCLDPHSDEAALECLKLGVIDRVSVFVGVNNPDRVKEALRHANIKIDLHLHCGFNLSLRQPGWLTSAAILWNRLWFWLRINFDNNIETSLERLWQEQIASFQHIFGRYPDGLNSHEHVHLHPKLFPVFVRIARQHQISYVRFGQEPVPQRTGFRGWLMRSWQRKDQVLFADSGLTTTRSFVSYDWYSSHQIFTEQTPEGTEVIFHPQEETDRRALALFRN